MTWDATLREAHMSHWGSWALDGWRLWLFCARAPEGGRYSLTNAFRQGYPKASLVSGSVNVSTIFLLWFPVLADTSSLLVLPVPRGESHRQILIIAIWKMRFLLAKLKHLSPQPESSSWRPRNSHSAREHPPEGEAWAINWACTHPTWHLRSSAVGWRSWKIA